MSGGAEKSTTGGGQSNVKMCGGTGKKGNSNFLWRVKEGIEEADHENETNPPTKLCEIRRRKRSMEKFGRWPEARL